MSITESQLQVLRECSRDETAFQRLVAEITGLTQDIAARQRLETELEQFFALSVDLWCIADTDGHFLKLSPMWETTLGYSLDELTGQRFLNWVHPDDVQPTVDALLDLSAQQPVLNFVNRYRCRDGSYRFFEWRSRPQGKLIYATARDVTERERLESYHARLVALVESSSEAIISETLDGIITDWNPAAEQMYGYRAAEAIGQSITCIIPPDRRHELPPILAAIERGVALQSFETVRCHKDGTCLDVSLTISPIKDQTGRIVGISVTGRDITAQKRLEAHQAQLAAIVESSEDAILSGTLDGTVTSWNPAAETLFGYTRDEVMARPFLPFLRPEVRARLTEGLSRIERGDHLRRYETEIIARDGTHKAVSISLFPVKNKAGSVVSAASIIQDITERKRLESYRAQLAAIVESSDDAIVGRDREGAIMTWNRGAAALSGYSAEEVIGKRMPELFPAEHQQEFDENFVRIRDGESVKRYETELLCKDGRRVPISLSISPIRATDGTILGSAAIVQDITEHKRLQAYQAHLAALVESSSDAIVGRSLDGVITSWNPAAQALYGYTTEEVLGLPAIACVPPDRLAEFAANVEKVRRGESVKHYETTLLRKDGTPIDVSMTMFPVSDQTGPIMGMAIITQDITELRRARLALQESEARLRSIFETIDDAVWSMDLPSLKMFYLSPAAARITGRPLEAFRQNTAQLIDFLHPDDVNQIAEGIEAVVIAGSLNIETRVVRPDGELRWVNVRAWLIRDEQGQPLRIEGITSDITDRKLAQKRALELDIERERVRLLSDFITGSSHDLRTPLSIISSGVYLMARLDDPEKRQASAERVERQVQFLTTMIDELHQMVTLERLSHLDLVPVWLNSCVSDLAAGYSPKKPHVTVVCVPAPSPLKIMGDPIYLSQALTHLLDNAVRYSRPDGEVQVRTALREGEVIVEVEDRGIGMSPEHLEHIFEHLYKANHARTRTDEGAGLGLALVRRIMDLHQGHITVHSQLEVGTVIALHFPMIAAAS